MTGIENGGLIGVSNPPDTLLSGSANSGIWSLDDVLAGESKNAWKYNLTPGLAGQYFNGDWRSTISTGNIGTLPLSAPTLYTAISYGSRGDNYGFIAIGYFIPQFSGTYTFFTSSDDGSGVWIGDIASAASGRTTSNAVLNNNMGNGQGDTKRSGSIALTANIIYPIRIVHEEGGGGDNLTFSWSGPGVSETTSLTTNFFTPVLKGTSTIFGNYLQPGPIL